MRMIPSKAELQAAGVVIAMQKPSSARALRQALLGLLENRPASALPTPAPATALPTLHDRHVLVAEDNSVNQMVISGMLKKLGIRSTLAGNGQMALALLKENHNRFDLVLMDCEMPVLDGYATTRALRSFEQERQLAALPVIALTAHVLQEHQQQAQAAGMNDHIGKPLEFGLLREKLMEFLGAESAAPAAAATDTVDTVRRHSAGAG